MATVADRPLDCADGARESGVTEEAINNNAAFIWSVADLLRSFESVVGSIHGADVLGDA